MATLQTEVHGLWLEDKLNASIKQQQQQREGFVAKWPLRVRETCTSNTVHIYQAGSMHCWQRSILHGTTLIIRLPSFKSFEAIVPTGYIKCSSEFLNFHHSFDKSTVEIVFVKIGVLKQLTSPGQSIKTIRTGSHTEINYCGPQVQYFAYMYIAALPSCISSLLSTFWLFQVYLGDA